MVTEEVPKFGLWPLVLNQTPLPPHTGPASCQDVEATQADGSRAGPPGARAEQRRTRTLQSSQIETTRPRQSTGPDSKHRPYCSSVPPSGSSNHHPLYPQETARSLIRLFFCPRRPGVLARGEQVWGSMGDSTPGLTGGNELGCSAHPAAPPDTACCGLCWNPSCPPRAGFSQWTLLPLKSKNLWFIHSRSFPEHLGGPARAGAQQLPSPSALTEPSIQGSCHRAEDNAE